MGVVGRMAATVLAGRRTPPPVARLLPESERPERSGSTGPPPGSDEGRGDGPDPATPPEPRPDEDDGPKTLFLGTEADLFPVPCLWSRPWGWLPCCLLCFPRCALVPLPSRSEGAARSGWGMEDDDETPTPNFSTPMRSSGLWSAEPKWLDAEPERLSWVEGEGEGEGPS